MNNVNSSTFHAKLQEILPNLPSSISPEVLGKLCEDKSVQPFLKWFCTNIKTDNVLSNECTELKKHIQKNGSWLQGTELETALEEATRDCPELLKLIESDYWSGSQSFSDLTTAKDAYDADVEYLRYLENSTKKLKEQEELLDQQLDKEDEYLKQKEVTIKVISENCITALEDWDSCSRQFFEAVELLSNSYINAIEKKGEPCLWTQMPIELYIKQLETYNDYLKSYTKRQFLWSKQDEISENNENFTSYISESGENDKFTELLSCQQNIFTSKMHEIIAKAEAEANKSLVSYVTDIYNNGNLKVPSTPFLARAEIAEFTKTRDLLEENIYHLQERKLVDTVQQFSKARIIKVYGKEAEGRLEKKKVKLLRLESLYTLAKEHGYAFSTLLRMLLELQIRRINEIIQFVIDARHYLSMEYSLSSLRIESMRKLQNEYALISKSPEEHNAFCRMFTEMTSIMDFNDNLQASLQHYDELRNDNNNKLKILLDKKLDEVIKSSEILEKKVNYLFNQEIMKSPTLSFTAVPYELQNEMDKTEKQVQSLETNVELIKNKLKNMIKEVNEPSFMREKLLIWQKFLADPESLKARYEELKDVEARIKF